MPFSLNKVGTTRVTDPIMLEAMVRLVLNNEVIKAH